MFASRLVKFPQTLPTFFLCLQQVARLHLLVSHQIHNRKKHDRRSSCNLRRQNNSSSNNNNTECTPAPQTYIMSAQQVESTYTMGYSQATTASHSVRTAEVDAAFLIPHLKTTDRILDVGCGPGTITVGFASIAHDGEVVGIDISAEILGRAQQTAAKAGAPSNLSFRQGDVIKGLDWIPEGTFDVVYASQVFPHLPTAELRERALVEMRRVLKKDGILATRTLAGMEWYPKQLGLQELLNSRMNKGFATGDFVGSSMPAHYRRAGFENIKVGAGTRVSATAEERKWLVGTYGGRLAVGDTFRKSWIQAGITEEEIETTIRALDTWKNTEDAWYIGIQADILGWK